MRFVAAPCHVCGQAVLREERRFRPGARVICDEGCQAVLCSADSGAKVVTEERLCLVCGEAFRSDLRHLGAAHRPGGANLCPACWREGLEGHEPDGPYLDNLASLFAALAALLMKGARVFWAPRLACPRCGEPHRGATYEWSCRYPLAVGLCEGIGGEHVHSVCYRCGYEVVRLEMEKPPAGGPARGLACHGGAMTVSSSSNASKRPDSTTSLR